MSPFFKGIMIRKMTSDGAMGSHSVLVSPGCSLVFVFFICHSSSTHSVFDYAPLDNFHQPDMLW